MTGSEVDFGHWSGLGRELWRRSVRGLRHPSYVIYFLVAIVGIGAIALWMELYTWYMADPAVDTTAIRTAMVAFVPAFIASTSMQLIWAENQRSMKAVSILLLFICLVSLLLCKVIPPTKIEALYAGIFSTVVALWTWWIANADQADYLDSWSPEVTKGPRDVNAKLAGNTSGFKTD